MAREVQRERKLLEKLTEKLDYGKMSELITKDFMKALSERYNFKEIVGVFSKLGTIPTSDRGDMLAEDMIRGLSRELTRLGFGLHP